MIKKYYGRDSVVIYPPVDVERFRGSANNHDRNGFVVAGRMAPYKKIDLAVEACTKLSLPLTVAGDGPMYAQIKELAGPTIKFVGSVTDSDMPKHFAAARCLIFTGLEDFGIIPIEAMAAGTPVLAYKAGGALDYINPKTGRFFERQTVDSLVSALQKFDASRFKQSDLSNQAAKFSKSKFMSSIMDFVEQKCAG
jgi:glycosyltransferase involved in cell wall biosynthesis